MFIKFTKTRMFKMCKILKNDEEKYAILVSQYEIYAYKLLCNTNLLILRVENVVSFMFTMTTYVNSILFQLNTDLMDKLAPSGILEHLHQYDIWIS